MAKLTQGHDAVLALIDWLPEYVEADAEVVADLLGIPEAAAARLLDELEAAGDIASATGLLSERDTLEHQGGAGVRRALFEECGGAPYGALGDRRVCTCHSTATDRSTPAGSDDGSAAADRAK